MTGVLRLAKEISVSPLNNVTEFDILKSYISPYYGFSHEEVDQLIQLWHLNDEVRQSIKYWYNGYNFTGNTVYSPFSVALALNGCIDKNGEAFSCYWTESGNINTLTPILFNSSILVKLCGLLDPTINRLAFSLVSPLTYKAMKKIYAYLADKKSVKFNDQISVYDQNVIFSYLFFSGYLTKIEANSSKSCVVKLPNNEVKTYIESQLEDQFQDTLRREAIYQNINLCFKHYFESSQCDNEVEIKKFIQDFACAFSAFLHSLPVLEKLKLDSKCAPSPFIHANEDLVHCMLVATILYIAIDLSFFGTEVVVKDKKRCDVILVNQKVCMIIELKFDKNGEEALRQIKTNEYYKNFETSHDLFLIGLNISQNKSISLSSEYSPKVSI